MARRAAKVDDNQSQIVRALRGLGATVSSTASVGRGFPDIAVGYRGHTYLFEIKDPTKVPSARRLTDDEKRWHQEWAGQAAVILTAEDAIQIMMKDDPK